MPYNPRAIFNFCQVNDRIAIAGQPASDQYKLLQDSGYQVVFQLVVQEAPYSIQDEGEHIRQLNLEHVTMNVSFANPTAEDVQNFLDIMAEYADKKVFIHCAAGYCTSGLMMIYLMKHNHLTFEEAKSKVVQEWQPSDHWQHLIAQSTG